MTTISQHPIVVGVDGTPASDRAVQYGAGEAKRLGLGLHLVHAIPGERASGPPLPIIPDGALRTYGQEHLERAQLQASEAAPDLSVETSLVPGSVVATLVTSGEHASMIVLGADRRSLPRRIWTGAVVNAVAAQAVCPIAVIPPEWEPGTTRGRVVVGLKDVEFFEELLRTGLDLADARAAELLVVNAWKLPPGYDDVLANHVDVDTWGLRQTSLIEPIVQDLRHDHHDVPVRIAVLHAQPASALVDASAEADLLVIGRPKQGGPFHHLGAVARAVLREARCPVQILPPPSDASRHVG